MLAVEFCVLVKRAGTKEVSIMTSTKRKDNTSEKRFLCILYI